MQTIKDLKAKAQAAVDRQKALSDLATAEKRELTDAEKSEFDGLSASIDSALADIERLKQVEDRRAKIAAISTEAKDVTGVVDRIVQPTQAQIGAYGQTTVKDLSAAEVVGLAAWASAKNCQSPTKTAAQHLEDFTSKNGYSKINDLCKQAAFMAGQEKSWTTASGGDNAIFTPLSNDFIAYLYNQSAFLVGQPMIVDMPKEA